MNEIPKQPNRSEGIPFPVVVVGALIILGVLISAIYVIITELTQSGAAKSINAAIEQAGTKVQTIIEQNTQNLPVSTIAPDGTQEIAQSNIPAANQPKQPGTQGRTINSSTIDIGAYLTYGGKASSLDRAVAKLSSDNMRLIVGLFEATQGPKDKPALGIIFEFKEAQPSCSVSNIQEVTLLFNLKAMGNIAAQTTELTLKTESDFSQSIVNFSCDLKKGGRLDLHLLGSNPKIIRPSGSTFAWGLRLAQKIS
jgi:hypothetical protein